jgi:hypothetical protein
MAFINVEESPTIKKHDVHHLEAIQCAPYVYHLAIEYKTNYGGEYKYSSLYFSYVHIDSDLAYGNLLDHLSDMFNVPRDNIVILSLSFLHTRSTISDHSLEKPL